MQSPPPCHSHDKEDEMKSSVPFGELPALEVDLQLYSGVEPILRYVAQLAGFCPTDPIEVSNSVLLLDFHFVHHPHILLFCSIHESNLDKYLSRY